MTEVNPSSRRRTRIRTREIQPKHEPTSPSYKDDVQAQNDNTADAAGVSSTEDSAAAKERQRLKELEAFVESKMYMYPGEHGSLAAAGPGGMGSLAWGGPMVRVEEEKKGDKVRKHGVPIVVGGNEEPEETESGEKDRGEQPEVNRDEGSRLRRAWKKLVP